MAERQCTPHLTRLAESVLANDSAPNPRDMESESALVCFLSELQHKARQGDYVFRGEREAKGQDGHELPVTSSLYRWVQTNCRHPDHAIPGRLGHAPLPAAETRRLPALQNRIANEINWLLPELHAGTDNLKLLARVQHFGGPTNLIDFTRDCLVALFFACWDREGEENGVGWTGGEGRIVFLPEDENDARIVETPITDARAIAQRSVFCAEASGVLPADAYEVLYVPGGLKQQLRMYLVVQRSFAIVRGTVLGFPCRTLHHAPCRLPSVL